MQPPNQDKLEVHLHQEAPPIIGVDGELDFYSKHKLASVIEGLFAQQQYTFVLDMSRVEFADSAGLGFLILTQRRAETSGGRMAAIFHRRVAKTIAMMGLTEFFHTYESVETAKEAVA